MRGRGVGFLKVVCVSVCVPVHGLLAEHVRAHVRGSCLCISLPTTTTTTITICTLRPPPLTHRSRDEDPMIRGLALRSLTGLRLTSILEYVLQPLKSSLSDASGYVRQVSRAWCCCCC